MREVVEGSSFLDWKKRYCRVETKGREQGGLHAYLGTCRPDGF